MYKVILTLAAIGILAFSAGLTYARPDQGQPIESAAAQRQPLAASHGPGAGSRAPEPTAQPAPRLLLAEDVDERDQPAPALLVYLACILVGSAVGVGLVRRSQRQL